VRYFGGVGLGIPPIYDNRFLKGIHYLVMQQSRRQAKALAGIQASRLALVATTIISENLCVALRCGDIRLCTRANASG
jgi:hypothetical protein